MKGAGVLLFGWCVAVMATELPVRHHPVDLAPPAGMRLPEHWPLAEDGTITCSTCHGVEGIEEPENWQRLKRDAPGFLRGGPYRRLTRFCSGCHDKTHYARLNIHRQLQPDGRPDKRTCRYCHLEVPEQEGEKRPRHTELRLRPGLLCLGCHLKTPHLNSIEHLREPSDAVRERLLAHNRSGYPSLPLDGQGWITCVTCHDPHQPGVLQGQGSAAAEGDTDVGHGPRYLPSRWAPVYEADKAERLGALAREQGRPFRLAYRRLAGEVFLRLPARDGTLCNVCHHFED